jgi:hypothetical protein
MNGYRASSQQRAMMFSTTRVAKSTLPLSRAMRKPDAGFRLVFLVARAPAQHGLPDKRLLVGVNFTSTPLA